MDKIRKSFVALIADAIDTTKYGAKIPAGQYEGSRSYRQGIRQSDVSVQLRRINEAIAGARTLGLLSESTAKLSRHEISTLVKNIWAYRSIEAPQRIEEILLEALRERQICEDILTEASTTAALTAQQMEEGIWK